MDFASRDRYRHVVERIARISPISEVQVARKALQLARNAEADGNANENGATRAHVGFYLIDKGVAELEDDGTSPFIAQGENLASRPPASAFILSRRDRE